MPLSFISRESHLAVVGSKDETIKLLTFHVEHLEATLRQEREASREFAIRALDAMKATPASIPMRRVPSVPQTPTEATEPVAIDLTLIDENDNEALAFVARQEMPFGTRPTGTMVMRKIEQLREQVRQAKNNKALTNAQPGTIPQSVADRIEAAEQAGRKAAIEVGV